MKFQAGSIVCDLFHLDNSLVVNIIMNIINIIINRGLFHAKVGHAKNGFAEIWHKCRGICVWVNYKILVPRDVPFTRYSFFSLRGSK